MSTSRVKKYAVIRDTREKEGKGWLWPPSRYCLGTEDQTLKTGDYTLSGMEDFFIIERKGSVSEFAANINQKRFQNELERLDKFRDPWLLLEFDMAAVLSYPVGSGIPKHKWSGLRFRGPYLLKRLTEIQMNHRVQVVLCGAHGKSVASNIFKRMIEKYERIARETSSANNG